VYFFLSYARGDDDRFVEKFYRDLCQEVRVLTGEGRDTEVGFFDRHSIPPGAAWPEELVGALSRCKVFIALCSPRYYRSVPCGIEWNVFEQRLRRYDEQHRLRAPALIPLAWTNTTMHPVAAERQYDFDGFAEPYRRDGLRQMLRLGTNRRSYLRFVTALAERVVSTAETHQVAPLHQRPIFTDLTSPFVGAPGTTGTAFARDPTGTHQVHFVVVTGSSEQMRHVRENLDYYGATDAQWAPYRPRLHRPIGLYASDIAEQGRFITEVGNVDSLLRRLREDDHTNEIVVLLVDPWATRLASHRKALESYDDKNLPVSAVMIPWNHRDEETSVQEEDLQLGLHEALERNHMRRDMFHARIPTHELFAETLTGVLEEARNRLVRRGKPRRLPPDDPDDNRPILKGP